MKVTKVVDFVTWITEQLSLYFYDFSTNFYAFAKFAVYSSSIFCRLDPETFISFKGKSLAGVQNRGGAGAAISR